MASPDNALARRMEQRATALPVSNGQLLLWALLATITMLFAGLTSAYLVRRVAGDWMALPMPGVLWFNTGVLVLSSFTIEFARGSLKRARQRAGNGWMLATTLLGLLFLAGQLLAWRALAAQGIYLPTNPHSSFFFILTGLHGLHLLGGMVALLYALTTLWNPRHATSRGAVVDRCATYWHFLGGLWLYLVYLLFA